MKRRDLIRLLERAGFRFKEHGGNHDTYKRGTDTEQVLRHKEINEITAKKIIKKCPSLAKCPLILNLWGTSQRGTGIRTSRY